MRLVTTLIDKTIFYVLEIAQMYHLCWGIQMGFKKSMSALLVTQILTKINY